MHHGLRHPVDPTGLGLPVAAVFADDSGNSWHIFDLVPAP
jgi:hypothetical protein